ncbi:hypothetical protein KJ854_00725, partial [Patescibacteria group bacterium]|nr:hypothetical protein [Patescibacteria group bacterium]
FPPSHKAMAGHVNQNPDFCLAARRNANIGLPKSRRRVKLWRGEAEKDSRAIGSLLICSFFLWFF